MSDSDLFHDTDSLDLHTSSWPFEETNLKTWCTPRESLSTFHYWLALADGNASFSLRIFDIPEAFFDFRFTFCSSFSKHLFIKKTLRSAWHSSFLPQIIAKQPQGSMPNSMTLLAGTWNSIPLKWDSTIGSYYDATRSLCANYLLQNSTVELQYVDGWTFKFYGFHQFVPKSLQGKIVEMNQPCCNYHIKLTYNELHKPDKLILVGPNSDYLIQYQYGFNDGGQHCLQEILLLKNNTPLQRMRINEFFEDSEQTLETITLCREQYIADHWQPQAMFKLKRVFKAHPRMSISVSDSLGVTGDEKPMLRSGQYRLHFNRLGDCKSITPIGEVLPPMFLSDLA